MIDIIKMFLCKIGLHYWVHESHAWYRCKWCNVEKLERAKG